MALEFQENFIKDNCLITLTEFSEKTGSISIIFLFRIEILYSQQNRILPADSRKNDNEQENIFKIMSRILRQLQLSNFQGKFYSA